MVNTDTLVARMREAKSRGEKIAALTAYDYPTARLLDEAGVDLILVGDSLGMVVLGYADTTSVTMDDMVHHTRATARAVERALVVADLPYGSYETPDLAVRNARRLLDAGAKAVKFEGGRPLLPQAEALAREDIPLLGHLGMLPQQVQREGGYKVKGRTPAEAEAILADAQALAAAGAFGIVLELVEETTAARVTSQLEIPTIGIGSGPGCDGQILVTHDLIGLFPWFTPRFAKPRAHTGEEIRRAAVSYIDDVKGQSPEGQAS